MSACCSQCAPDPAAQQRTRQYRLVLWAVLFINAAMFAVEVGAGLASGSAALLADSLNFLADAANYGISLFVVGMALRRRAQASLFKAVTMAAFGIWVVGVALWNLTTGVIPEAETMGVVGLAALLANALAFGLLWQFRSGDSNMRSAWICTRNDVVGNMAVLAAAAGVFGTGSGWPDVTVALIMGGLALQGAASIIRQARAELALAPAMRAAE